MTIIRYISAVLFVASIAHAQTTVTPALPETVAPPPAERPLEELTLPEQPEPPQIEGSGFERDGLTKLNVSLSHSLRKLKLSQLRVQSNLALADMQMDRAELLAQEQAGASAGEDKKLDAPHQLYKEAYNLILDEEWTSARKKFAELKTKYPKSDLIDDATYWSAYAEKNIDTKKAIKEYKDFIANYHSSQYYDDAVADLDQLKADSDAGSSSTPRPEKWRVYSDDSTGTMVVASGRAPRAYSMGSGRAVGFGSSQSAAIARLRRDTRRSVATTIRIPRMPRMPRMPRLTGVTAPAAVSSPFWGSHNFDEDTLDEKTRLKMDALQALGDSREDSLSFRTLRDVAVDKKQPRELRITALDALSNYRKYDVLPIFIQVAKTETDPDLQNTAIDVISDLGGEKSRGVDALIEIYKALPASSKDQRSSLFYAIADIGNDKAVDFLAGVARSSDDYNLKREAISYLGNIGGEKARKALMEILKDN